MALRRVAWKATCVLMLGPMGTEYFVLVMLKFSANTNNRKVNKLA